jgi:hypothetical protein
LLGNDSIASIQTLPWTYKANGCGKEIEDEWIQIAILQNNSKEYFDKAFREACELMAYLCAKYNINPLQGDKTTSVPYITTHKEAYSLNKANKGTDIDDWLLIYGKKP